MQLILTRAPRAVLAFAFALAITCSNAQVLWGNLPKGPYHVGFRSLWQFDYSRSYSLQVEGSAPSKVKEPRPILTNIWYPAVKSSAKPMAYEGYFHVASRDLRLGMFPRKLIEYNRDVVVRELFRKPEKELNNGEKGLLQGFLKTATAAVRNAEPAKGSFPIVIYHSGYGSSFDDNSVFCEYLASQGYIVLGSAYQQLDGKGFNINGNLDTADDLEFLINFARTLPSANWQHVGIVGHSGGAHSAICFQSQVGSPVDAIVSLDTTEDYHSLALPLWKEMRRLVQEENRNYTKPILFAADPGAIFVMADLIVHATRYYLTVNDLSHNEFVFQGQATAQMQAKVANAQKKAEMSQRQKDVWSGYEVLCKVVKSYLDQELKGLTLATQWPGFSRRPTMHGFNLEVVPAGAGGPTPYLPNSTEPPSPRQFRQLVRADDGAPGIQVLSRFKGLKEEEPIYQPNFAFDIVYELMADHRSEDAQDLFKAWLANGVEVDTAFLGWGQLFSKIGAKDVARDILEKLLLLQPGNERAKAELAKLQIKGGDGH